MDQNAGQGFDHKNSNTISRRGVLGVCLTGGLIPAMSEIAEGTLRNTEEVTPQRIGVTARARNEVLQRAYSQMQFLHVLYGLDKEDPVVLKDGAAFVKCIDPLGVLPEVSEIRSAYSGDTKVGQLHAMVTGIYTALHCEGKDGITDKEINAQADAGFVHTQAGKMHGVRGAKSALITMMKMQAGLIPANQANYQRQQQAVTGYADSLSQWRAGGPMQVASGKFNENIYKRIALGLQHFLTHLQSNPRNLRSATAQRAIAEFDENFSRFLAPEFSKRVLTWGLRQQNEDPSLPKFAGMVQDRAHTSRLVASYNSLRLLFGDRKPPKISCWIPFKADAMPEYRIWYADHKQELSMPLFVAYNTDAFRSEIPDLSRYKERYIDINSFLPGELRLFEGAVRALNLSVGLSGYGSDLRLDRRNEVKKEAESRGVRISSEESNDRGGLLLSAVSGFGDKTKWGEAMWPDRASTLAILDGTQ